MTQDATGGSSPLEKELSFFISCWRKGPGKRTHGTPAASYTHPPPEEVPVLSCPPSDPSRPRRAECSRVRLTLMVNRDIPNL